MNNNDMIKYKESFISKIKRFFVNLFKDKKEQEKIFDLNSNEFVYNNDENKFFNNLKVNTNDFETFIEKKKFLEYIDGNVEALNILSVDRLIKLKEYYDEVIEKNENIIKNFKIDK